MLNYHILPKDSYEKPRDLFNISTFNITFNVQKNDNRQLKYVIVRIV